MSYILDSIVGPYPFLLIAQILIVSALLLSLIWIFIQRAQEVVVDKADHGESASMVAVAAPVPTPAAVATPAAPKVESPVEVAPTAPPSEVPAAPVSQANEVEAQKLAAEAEGLKDKVRYLESRLMEYEIVQEEISNLGSLRSENEKLKEELLRLNASAGVAAPAAEPVQSVSSPNEVLESVSKNQIDTILDKLDKITQKD